MAFVPWVLFTLITQHDSLKAGAIAALGASVIIALPSLIAGRPKLLELGAILAFAGFAIVAFSADAATGALVARATRERWGRHAGGDCVRFVATGPIHRTVRTESVPVSSGHRPASSRSTANCQLTLMWAWVFVAMIPSHPIAAAIDTRRANTILN